MKAKEIVIDTLIGSLLVVAFLAAVVALFGGVGLSLYGLNVAAKHFLPGVSMDIWSFALLMFLLMARTISHLRKCFWSNALLSFSMIAVVLPALLMSDARVDLFWWFGCPMFVLFLIPEDRPLLRWESALLGATAVVGPLLTAGLLVGTPARGVAISLFLAILVWITFQARHRWFAGGTLKHLSQTKR